MQDLDEKTIEELEEIFPTLAAGVFDEARRKALESGLSIIESEDGALYQVFPDGTRKFVKHIEPPTYVTPGTTFELR